MTHEIKNNINVSSLQAVKKLDTHGILDIRIHLTTRKPDAAHNPIQVSLTALSPESRVQSLESRVTSQDPCIARLDSKYCINALLMHGADSCIGGSCCST